MRSRRGFTLIELLVVIAIIAILAAILFAVFLKATKSGQKSTRVSNSGQMGLAMPMYVDGNNDRCPAQDHGTLPPGFTVASLTPQPAQRTPAPRPMWPRPCGLLTS